MVRVTMEKPEAVYVAPVTENTEKWGVCCIPVMWKLPDGSFVVRVNGGQDTSFAAKRQQTRDGFFRSRDNGDTWEVMPHEEGKKLEELWTSIEPIFTPLRDGTWLALRREKPLAVVPDTIPVQNYVPGVSRETVWNAYRMADLPGECVAATMQRYNDKMEVLREEDACLDFPELCPSTVSGSQYRDGKEVLIEEFVPQPVRMHKFYAIAHPAVELSDGTVLGLLSANDISVRDHRYEQVWCVSSTDGGVTWQKRGQVSQYDAFIRNGYTYENSMVRCPDGSLITVMRTEHCVVKELEPFTGLMFSRSEDEGKTWSKPIPITDSSVTPHLIALKNGVIVLVYGRPGNHILYSEDSGHTWQGPYTVIGHTLSQHRARGDEYMDSKYWNMETYANTSMEAVDDETVLLCYNDMRYQTGDGKDHRATLTRRIRFEKGEG